MNNYIKKNLHTKYIHRLYLTIFCMVYSIISLNAQSNIKGSVYDDDKNPVYLANIVLSDTTNTFITGLVSEETGSFILELPDKMSLKDTKLTISYIGYVKHEVVLDTVSNIGNIVVVLSPDNTILGEVTVTAQRKLFQTNGSVLTANVENTILSKSGNLDDLMNKIPFVSGVDASYEVFGRGQALVYLNGQKVYEPSVLKNLLSEDIKKIDVITNPGPRYDSSVQSVIKIFTKPKQGDGIGGNMYSYFQQGRRMSDNENITLKYRKNNYEWMGAISHSGTRMKTYSKESHLLMAETNSKTDSEVGIDYHSNYFTGTIGMNYNSDDELNTGFTSIFNTGDFINEVTSKEFKHYSNDVLSFENPMTGLSKDVPKRWLTNGYYSQKKGITQMDISGDLLIGSRSNSFAYLEDDNSVAVNTNGKMNYFMGGLIVDFSSLIENIGQLSYGIESSYSIDNQEFGFDESNIDTNMDNNLNKRIQLLLASYLSWEKTIGIFTIDGGLRYELVKFDYFKNGILEDEQSKVYNDVFPTINISLKPSKDINVNLGYKTTINRPSYYILNDNINYINRYYYSQGNSLLKSQKRHSINSIISIKKILLNASYDKIYNSFFNMKSQYKKGEEIILSKISNTPKLETLSLGVSWSDRFGLYSPSVEVNTGKQFLSAEYLGEIKSYNQPFINIRTNHSLQLPNNFIGNIGITYRSHKYNMFSKVSYQWNSSIRISKSFKNGLFVQLGANNFFVNPLKTESITMIDNVFSSTINDSDIRNISLLVSYRFNSTKDKYFNAHKSSERSRY